MKKEIFRRNLRAQATVTGRPLRVPGMLSVAVVSGALAIGSCGGNGKAAQDGAPRDGRVQMVDAEQAADAPQQMADAAGSPDAAAVRDVAPVSEAGDGRDAGRDLATEAAAMTCGEGTQPCCPGKVCNPPNICANIGGNDLCEFV